MKKRTEKLYWTAVGRMQELKDKAAEIWAQKTAGASHFVEILVAIIIIVAIGYIFKDQITAFITTITTRATTDAVGLF